MDRITSILVALFLTISIAFMVGAGAALITMADDINTLYQVHSQSAQAIYTIMDTEVRILHYAKPHRPQPLSAGGAWAPVTGCVECYELLKKAKDGAKKRAAGEGDEITKDL